MNTSGIHPIGHRVLIYPLPKERVTSSGIIIPEPTAGREDMAQVIGIMIEAGPTAGKDYGWPELKAGERVIYAKYAGNEMEGKDGKKYRLINDEDLAAYTEIGEDNA